jgi:hypothetical protein
LAAAVAKVVQPRRADARSAGAKSLPGARPWPEGASGLGAIPRDAEQQPRWSLPPPSWSPFATD